MEYYKIRQGKITTSRNQENKCWIIRYVGFRFCEICENANNTQLSNGIKSYPCPVGTARRMARNSRESQNPTEEMADDEAKIHNKELVGCQIVG